MKPSEVVFKGMTVRTRFVLHSFGKPYLAKQVNVQGSVASVDELKAWWDYLLSLWNSNDERLSQDAFEAARRFYNKAVNAIPFSGAVDFCPMKCYAYDTKGEIRYITWFAKRKMGDFDKFYKEK